MPNMPQANYDTFIAVINHVMPERLSLEARGELSMAERDVINRDRIEIEQACIQAVNKGRCAKTGACVLCTSGTSCDTINEIVYKPDATQRMQ